MKFFFVKHYIRPDYYFFTKVGKMPKAKVKNIRFRNFVFTWNNYDDNTVEYLRSELGEDLSYMVVGKEVGEEKKTPHLQGYVELNKQKSFRQIKKLLQNNHFEKRRGTALQAANYCKKDGDFKEFGTISHAGFRSDLHDLRDALLTGMDDSKLVQIDDLQETIARYPKYVQFVRRARVPRRTFRTELHIIWGDTGTGKSYKANQLAGEQAYWKDCTTGIYWDNYNGTDDVVIDDFGGEIPLRQMLKICDETKLQVQNKGSWMNFCSKRVFITSNMHPREWWNEDQRGYEANYKAFLDRITSIEHMTGPSRRQKN